MTARPPRPYRVSICTVTPFDERGRLDDAAVVALVERVAGQGLGLAVGTASPGEGFSLSLEETEHFLSTVVRVAAGRVPVCAMGYEPRSAAQLKPIVRAAERAKVDVMQLYTVDPGHAMKATANELLRYFRTLLDDISIPAAISTHHYNGLVPLPVLAELLDRHPRIHAIHCTSEVDYLQRLLALVDGRCDVLVGGPMQALSTFALGGQGFLCTEGNLAPVVCGELLRAIRSGEWEAARVAYRRLIGLFAANVWPGGSVRFLKTAMKVLGIPGWHPRAPFELLDAEAEREVARALRGIGLPEWVGRV